MSKGVRKTGMMRQGWEKMIIGMGIGKVCVGGPAEEIARVEFRDGVEAEEILMLVVVVESEG